MGLWRLVIHVLGLLVLAVSGTYGTRAWLPMAVNRDGFVLYDEKWRNGTHYIQTGSTGAELLFAYNGHSLNTLIGYFHTVQPTFDIHLDGRMVPYGFDVTLLGDSNSTDPQEVDTNAQIITGGAPGDHQVLLRTTAPVYVLVAGFEIDFNSTTARSTTFGIHAGNIPQAASYIDNTGLAIAYSPDGWDLDARSSFAINKTFSRTSKPGAWVEVLLTGRTDPSTWLYGMISQEVSWAKAQVFKVDDWDRALSMEATIRVGGDESNQPLDSPVYQVPLYSIGHLDYTKAYIIRLTLLNGTLSFDFARTQSSFLPESSLQRPPRGLSLTQQVILITTLLLVGSAALALAVYYFRRRRSRQKQQGVRVKKSKTRMQFIGEPTRPGHGLSLTIPVPFDSSIATPATSYTPTSSTMMRTGIPAMPTSTRTGPGYFVTQKSKSRMRGDVLGNNESDTSTAALIQGVQNDGHAIISTHEGPDASLDEFPSDIGAPAEENQTYDLGGSLLFSSTTSYLPATTSDPGSSVQPTDLTSTHNADGSGGGGEDEEETLMLTHEDLAVVFQRATDLRGLHNSTSHTDGDKLEERRQPERLEALARQLAGIP